MTSSLLKLQGLTKHFGGVVALAGVDFDLRSGEIHALLGENGAGKSTLIKTLGGIHRPDSGDIFIDDQTVAIRDVTHADKLGIRIIHQELALVPNLSVAENIYLGREPTRFGLVDRGRMRRDAAALIAALGLREIGDVNANVSELTVARQQLVEIARALSGQARILVLDEPTSSLSESETEMLFGALRRLRGQGVGIIYISHRLEEIIRLADRITVLRDGRSVGTREAKDVSQAELIRWMVGRDIAQMSMQPPRLSRHAGIALQVGESGPALSVRHLCNPRVHDVSFDVHYGEILGFAGLVGAGRSELARALFGIDRIESGEILVDGKPVSIRSPRDALDAGIVLVPEDRKREGLVILQSVGFNLALPWTREWITGPIIHSNRRRAIIDRAVRDFQIKCSTPDQAANSLSGGNQQKIVVGKWMEHRPRVLILDEPTRGVDVGAREEMFRIIHGLVESGMAVILISSDLPEVMNLSHRLAIYKDGRIVSVGPRGKLTSDAVMAQLTGAAAHEIV